MAWNSKSPRWEGCWIGGNQKRTKRSARRLGDRLVTHSAGETFVDIPEPVTTIGSSGSVFIRSCLVTFGFVFVQALREVCAVESGFVRFESGGELS